MKPDINGTWCSQFKSPTGINNLTLELNLDGAKPSASMHLVRPTPDPVKGMIEFDFNVRVDLCGIFVGLLSKDTENIGMNAMILKVSEDRNALSGVFVFNNIRTNEVAEGAIEWKRSATTTDACANT
jgi:hypothetical protein